MKRITRKAPYKLQVKVKRSVLKTLNIHQPEIHQRLRINIQYKVLLHEDII